MSDPRDSAGRGTPADRPAGDDPTLSAPEVSSPAAADAAPDDAFPDTVEGPRLVLFQRADGAVELRWRLDPTALAHARAAFPADAEPHAHLVLKALDGGAHPLADADLDATHLTDTGVARYETPDTEGPLLAEIGLGDAAGGWMLVARSNRLEAVGPVGVDFLREDDRRDAPDGAAGEHEPPAAPAAGAVIGPDRGTATPPLAPDFPLVPPPVRGDGSQPGTPSPPAGAAPGEGPPAAAVVEPDGDGTGSIPPPIGVTVPDPAPATDDPAVRGEASSMQVEQVVIMTDIGAAAAEAGDGAGAAPPPSEAAPQQGESARVGDGDRPAAGGSGPIVGARPGEGLDICAELLVYGSGPPGQLVTLGGHHYRIGPGGRFLLRVPVTDRALIDAMLAQLEHLPVPARDADEYDP